MKDETVTSGEWVQVVFQAYAWGPWRVQKGRGKWYWNHVLRDFAVNSTPLWGSEPTLREAKEACRRAEEANLAQEFDQWLKL